MISICLATASAIGRRMEAVEVLLVNSVQHNVNISMIKSASSFCLGMMLSRKTPIESDSFDFYIRKHG